MDPNATLELLRKLLTDARSGGLAGMEAEALQEVSDLFGALDQWLTRGGFLPDYWATTSTIRVPRGAKRGAK